MRCRMAFSALAFTLTTLSLVEADTGSARVSVDIFYETRCPFSLRFLNETLREVWDDQNFWKVMDVKLHPFGNARELPSNMVSKGYHFWHTKAKYPLIM